jgi:broad specificity phosphatase PhoE
MQSFHHASRLILVRHGETEGQSSIRYYGRTDVPLSAHGCAQMRCVQRVLAGQRFSRVYASALCRAVEAAEIIGGTTGVTRVAGFNEIDFGDWEGLTVEEIAARFPALYARWVRDRSDFHYPGGERTRAFRTRVVAALHDVLAAAPTGDLLFVLHKGVIRSILMELLRLNEAARHSLVLALGSIHIVSRGDGGWIAEVLDRTDHL